MAAPTGTAGSTAGTTGTGGTGGSTPAGPKLITSTTSAPWNTAGTIAVTTSGTANVTVNDGSARQTWEGFGGAFNEAGWAQIMKLSAADQTKAMSCCSTRPKGRTSSWAASRSAPATTR